MSIDLRSPDLPLRPRLAPGQPILSRPNGVQIGIDCSEALLITDPPPGLSSWLRLLDGAHGSADLYRAGARLGLTRPQMRSVLERLTTGGLLGDAAATRQPAQARIRLVGAGLLGRAVARLLAGAGLVALELIDDDPVDPSLYPRRIGLVRQSAALHAELTAQTSGVRSPAMQSAERPDPGRPSLVTIGPPWSVAARAGSVDPHPPSWPQTPAPDLTVIASDRLGVDRSYTDPLLRSDQAHLLLHPTGGGIVVGPLVVPGRTACVRCTDLVRRDLDPDWPALLSQLCRTSGSPAPSLVGWAAATAVTQAMALLDDAGPSTPETADATIELGRDHVVRRRMWPRHPDCGCSWVSLD